MKLSIIIPYDRYKQYLHDCLESVYEQRLNDYETLLVVNNKKEIEEKYIHELMAYKIQGLIVLSNTISSEELASYKLPVVTIERECDHVCSVSTDNYLGGVQATSLLIRNKCDVILHINSIFPDTARFLPHPFDVPCLHSRPCGRSKYSVPSRSQCPAPSSGAE